MNILRLAVMKMKKEPDTTENKTAKNAASVWVANAAHTKDDGEVASDANTPSKKADNPESSAQVRHHNIDFDVIRCILSQMSMAVHCRGLTWKQ